MCTAAVTSDKLALRHVPDHMKTVEMCTAAVTAIGCALDYVPEQMKTVEVCTTAVRKSGSALEKAFCPESLASHTCEGCKYGFTL